MEVAESGNFKIVGFSDLSTVFLAEIKKHIVRIQVRCKMEQSKVVKSSGKSETNPGLLFL